MNTDFLQSLDKGAYQNNKVLEIGGLPFTVRDIAVRAPLIAGLNVYLIGSTGEGKSQLCYDLKDYAGDSYCYSEGRLEFELSELFKQVRLDKDSLNNAKTDRELVELTENVKKSIFYVEELNRCPPTYTKLLFQFFWWEICS